MNFWFFHFSRQILDFSANFWWIFVRISRQIPEKSDVCRFFNQICENKSEICRKFWILWKKFTIIVNYSLHSLTIITDPSGPGAPRRPALGDPPPRARPAPRARRAAARGPGAELVLRDELNCHGIRQTLEGSFSAVSTPNFASKNAFESSRRDLHHAVLCTAPKSHFFQKKIVEFSKICEIRNFSNRFFAKILRLQRRKRMQIL